MVLVIQYFIPISLRKKVLLIPSIFKHRLDICFIIVVYINGIIGRLKALKSQKLRLVLALEWLWVELNRLQLHFFIV